MDIRLLQKMDGTCVKFIKKLLRSSRKRILKVTKWRTIDKWKVDKQESDERTKKTDKNLVVCWSVKIKSNNKKWNYRVIE